MWKSLVFLVFLVFLVSLVFLVFLVSLVFLVPVLCSSVPLQPSPNKRAQAPADSIEFPMGSKETLARNWSFHFSQVNYISLFIFVVDRDLSRNSCLTHATTVLSVGFRAGGLCAIAVQWRLGLAKGFAEWVFWAQGFGREAI